MKHRTLARDNKRRLEFLSNTRAAVSANPPNPPFSIRLARGFYATAINNAPLSFARYVREANAYQGELL
jgi:hypothetical protein